MPRFFLVAISLAVSFLGIETPAFGGVDIKTAIQDGKVEVKVTGRGSSTGDAIDIRIKRKVPETIVIDIAPGTVFTSKSGDVQSMVFKSIRFEKVTGGWKKTDKIVLHDDRL